MRKPLEVKSKAPRQSKANSNPGASPRVLDVANLARHFQMFPVHAYGNFWSLRGSGTIPHSFPPFPSVKDLNPPNLNIAFGAQAKGP